MESGHQETAGARAAEGAEAKINTLSEAMISTSTLSVKSAMSSRRLLARFSWNKWL